MLRVSAVASQPYLTSVLARPPFQANGRKPWSYRGQPTNYRPISLLPILSKVMERIVHDKLSLFLSPWLTKNQSGFKKGDGTVPQLIRLMQTWSDAVDKDKYVGAVFFDLRKAFDRVWHDGLLAKLRVAGVHGSAHQWLASFLTNRHQTTAADGSLSQCAPLKLVRPSASGSHTKPVAVFCLHERRPSSRVDQSIH